MGITSCLYEQWSSIDDEVGTIIFHDKEQYPKPQTISITHITGHHKYDCYPSTWPTHAQLAVWVIYASVTIDLYAKFPKLSSLKWDLDYIANKFPPSLFWAGPMRSRCRDRSVSAFIYSISFIQLYMLM